MFALSFDGLLSREFRVYEKSAKLQICSITKFHSLVCGFLFQSAFNNLLKILPVGSLYL